MAVLPKGPHTHQSLMSGQWQSCPSTTYSSVSQVRAVAVLPKYHIPSVSQVRTVAVLPKCHILISLSGQDQWQSCPSATYWISLSGQDQWQSCPSDHILISLSGQDQWQSCPSDHILISLSGQGSGSLAQVPHTHQSLRSGQWQSCPSTTYSSVCPVRTVAVLPKYHILISLSGQDSGSLAQVPHDSSVSQVRTVAVLPKYHMTQAVSQVRTVAVLPKYHILISLTGQGSGSLAQVPHTHQSLRSGQWQSCPSTTYSSVCPVRTVAVLPKYHILISLSGQDSGSLAQVPHTSSVSQVRTVAVLPKYHILISLTGQGSGSLAQVPHTHQSLMSGQWQSCPSTTYSSVSQIRAVAVLPKYHILISLSDQDSGSLAQVPHTHQSLRSGQWQSCPEYHILISLSGQGSGSLAQVPHTHQSLRSGQWQSCPKYHILISLSGQDSGSLAQAPHTHQSLRSGLAVLPKYHILISLSGQDSGSLAQVSHTHQSLRSGQWQSCPSTTYSSVSQVRTVSVLPKYHILISLSGQDWQSCPSTTYSSVSQVKTVAVLPKYHILISLSGQDSGSLAQVPHTHQSLRSGQWQSCPSTTYSSVSQVRTVAVLPKYHILISLSGQGSGSLAQVPHTHQSLRVRTVAVLPKYHILISLSGQGSLAQVPHTHQSLRSGQWQSCPSTTYSPVCQDSGSLAQQVPHTHQSVRTVAVLPRYPILISLSGPVAVLPKYHILISLSGQGSGSLVQVPHTHQSLTSGQWQSCPSTTYSPVCQDSGSLAQQVPHTHQSLRSGQWQSCPSTTYSSVSQVRAVAVLPKYHILISLTGQGSGSLAQVPHTHQSHRSGQWQSCPSTTYSSVSQVRTVAVLPKYHILISLSGQDSGQVPHTLQSLRSGQWQSCLSTTYSSVSQVRTVAISLSGQDSGSLAQVPHTHQSLRSGQWQSCPCTTYSPVSQVRTVAVLPKYHILISLSGQDSGSLAQVPHTHQSLRSGQWQSCPSTTYSSVSQVRAVAVLPKYHILIRLSCQYDNFVKKLFHTYSLRKTTTLIDCLIIYIYIYLFIS